jgi:hypothetical protein
VTDWESRLLGVAVGAATGIVIGLLAFAFLGSQQHPAMGLALFALVPLGAGFSVTLVTRSSNSAIAASLLAVLTSLVVLIATGREGVLCAILAFPIILTSLLIGVAIGLLARMLISNRGKSPTTTGMLLLLAPALVLAGGKLEKPILAVARIEVVQSAIEVNDSPERVWKNILTIDNIQAGKPFLMHIGLPVPQKCVLQGEGVGAKRTCYFDSGYIEETITAWNPPSEMKLTIDRTQMPGRHWLGFESAEYTLEPKGRTTVLTRRTTISSYLHPAWYWRRFERWGVESEHDYILHDVANKAR